MDDIEPPGAQRRFATCRAPFDACEVTLALYGTDLDPRVVSERLGRQPTYAHRKGEPRPTGKRAPTAQDVARFGVWLFSIEASSSTLPGELVARLLDQFPSQREFWSSLCGDYEVQVRFAFQVGTPTGCFELDPTAAERLAHTGATLAFHFYGFG